jgi:hypothetical protein
LIYALQDDKRDIGIYCLQAIHHPFEKVFVFGEFFDIGVYQEKVFIEELKIGSQDVRGDFFLCKDMMKIFIKIIDAGIQVIKKVIKVG